MSSMQPGFSAAGTFNPDNLLSGEFPLVAETAILTGAAPLPRGAVLGIVTATGKMTLSLAAAADGSEAPATILLDNADPSGGDVAVPVAKTGSFNQRRLTLGAGHTVDSVREELEGRSIFLRNALGA